MSTIHKTKPKPITPNPFIQTQVRYIAYNLTTILFSLSHLSLLSLSKQKHSHSFLSPTCEPERSNPTTTMFRRATSSLLSRAVAIRRFSTDVATPATDSSFVEAWNKVSPNLDPPKTPLAFIKSRPPIPSTLPTKLTVNFVLPYASELSAKEVHFFPKFSFRFVLVIVVDDDDYDFV